jgi:mRNA interferase YafQ
MYHLVYTNRFKKDIGILNRRGYNMDLLKKAIRKLEESGQLSGLYRQHKLSGNYSGYMEAHLHADWLVIWKYFADEKEIWLTRTGTHNDLF